MFTKIRAFIKKILVFVGVAVGSFAVLFLVFALAGLYGSDGASGFAVLANLFLPIVFGVFAARRKRPGLPSSPLADRTEKAEEQILPAADPAPVVPAAEAPAQAQNVKKYKVAGVTHYVDNILELATEDPDYDLSKRELIAEDRVQERVWKYFFAPQKVELVPEDDNPQDPKAIKVVVDGQHVGYIKSGSCAHLRKVMDRGGIVDIDCMIGGGPYKYVALEYDDETDKEIYTLEKDETHIFVHLDITEKA